ncbi:sacsin-like [Haliotis cracherodii]|uniref:sacsin-like n=1 Tax=Haliotis cracherodii TaxID=6455 RepID=UPI0039E73E92
MSQDSESDDDGYMCMELPTLIKQLKSVLEQYPDDGQILKELIQNAEDAEASEMRILYDVRHIDPDSRLLKKKRYLASLQAPALCVYNDALFTEKDWRGIKMLHDSVKEEEPLKVGRFGLGFKSVFHVTDFPCVISGDTVLFINPQEKNSDRVCYMKKLRELPNEIKKMILNVFSGIFDFTSDTVHKGYYSGTIFWFPLRTNISKLSDNLYTEEKVKDLFQAFKSEASITLLFLKSIEKIQLYQTLRRKIQVQFSLQLSQDCLQHVRMEKRDFMRKVKQAQGGIPAASVESQLTLTVETGDVAGPKSSQQWIVINFYKGGTMSPRFRDLCSDKALSYAPYVGLAVPLGQQCKGHVFCFLPLPLESRSPTGLQVHVNGFFALNQNRRHVKWPTADQLQNQAHTDKAMEWNKCLVSEVLPEVYYSIVNALVQCCKVHTNSIIIIQQIYRMIPDIDDVDVNWKPLVSTLLKQLHNIPLLFTPSDQRMGIKMKDAFLVDVASDAYSLIIEIFTLYKRYIVPVPSKLMRTLEKHFSSHIHEVTPKDVCDTLRLNSHFTRLPRQKKLMLLKYLLESDQYKHLRGLCLLPVADGNFVAFGAPAAVFICDQPEDVKLFPGLESQLVSLDLPEDLQQVLMKRAGGGWKGLSVMSPAAFPGMLQKCLLRHFPEGNAKLPSPSLDVSWLRQVWTYITAHGFDVESVFSGFLIVPDIDAFDRGRLHRIDDVFIAQSVRHSESLPPNVGAALQKLGIVHLMYVPDFVLKNSHTLGTIIQYSNPVGVVRALEKVYRNLSTAVQLFNSESSKQERSALVAYMSTCQRQLSEGSKAVLRKLQLFTATDNSDCSVETLCTLAPDEQIPVPYPERYIQCSSAAVRHLAMTLGATERPFVDVSQQILQMMLHNKRKYTESHMVDFMEFLMENHLRIVNETRQIASEVRFLSSSGGLSGQRACDLFSRNDPSLRELFLGEDKFPADRHTRTDRLRRGLEAIGLKTEKEVSESDVRTSAKTIEELVIRGMESEAGRKVTAFITFLERSTDRMDTLKLFDLQHVQCIPCMQKKISRYPKSLSWKGESGPKILSSGKVFSSRYSSVIGSVSPVAKETTTAVEAILGLDRVPQVCSVLEHLHNLGTSYDCRECNPCMDLLKDIYSFLSSQDVSSTEKNMMESSQSVWVGIEEGFHSPRSVYCERSDADLDLKPYRYQLPSLLHGWGSLLCSCGCHQRQTPDMLATVLEEIKEKHDEFKIANLKKPTVVRQDLKLVLQILNELQEHPQRPDHVLVPVHQASDDFLLLLPAEYCTYCNADWLQDQISVGAEEGEEQEIFYVHANISEHTAQQFGVYSLTDRVMDDTEDFDMEYHQSEPLTRRLKNLLHEYTDGFSVPKELIQNADDAGATEVCFMYDERQNLNARTFLMNENMAGLQGPALWAYNDASFTQSDFANLKKLSGATKEEDTAKVGKFGLGFNSVYNLTDVPSFISENTLVIFDPHKSYLGRPGLKANLQSVKNQKMLRNMSGQLKPFEGIFGCQFMKKRERDSTCHGTLFRFPLRTPEQAAASKIKDLSYSRHEMENFFRKFAEGCGNLTLFTQNVSSVKFFYLPHNGDPNEPELLIHVAKEIRDQRILSPPNSFLNGPNVLSHAAEEWKKQTGLCLKISEKSDVQLEICDTDMTRMQKLKAGVTIVSWLITWVTGQGESEQFARSGKLKGLLPLAAVAIPLTLEDGRQCIYKMDKCPEGFYREGHYFCFLPLPVHIPFPVHINAPFALTSDRRQLCTQTEDDKTNSEAEWNTALFKDATCRAYVAGLEQLEITDPSTVGQYYDLWPTMQSGQDCMVRSFYELITHEAHDVFLHDDNGDLEWLSFQRTRILEPNFRWNGDIGTMALKATTHFTRTSNKTVLDLPQNLLRQFYSSGLGKEVNSVLITTSEFYKTIFFPNIHDSYWSPTERDILVLFALKYQDESIHDLIRSTRCIPTEPFGILKMPWELIHPKGQCAGLFSEKDQCFPKGFQHGDNEFCERQVLETLCCHGMIKDNLPWERLVERAQSVKILAEQDSTNAHERGGQILTYLGGSLIYQFQKRFHTCPVNIRSTLQNTPFLSVLKRTPKWPLEWKADGEQPFACTKELYDDKLTSFVACSQLLLDHRFDKYFQKDMELLSWLGVKNKEDVDLEVVARQLLYVSRAINTLTMDSSSFVDLARICQDIYWFMNCRCEKDATHVQEIHQLLANEETVLKGKQMLRPKQVAFHLPADLSPYLYEADKANNSCKLLFQSMGVRDRFQVTDVNEIMQDITREVGTNTLSAEQLKWFGRASQYILEIDASYSVSEDFDISLPDAEGKMTKATSLCIDDYGHVISKQSMRFVHPYIHPKVAKLLGAVGKRHVDLRPHISHFSEFGQSEKLTTRLKRLLSGYPCDSSLMKELLQNADDAGATELMFIKDFRHLPTEKLMCDEWASLQGPALCVYNDSFFTEGDIEGIQNLGVGSKSDDPVKTGQYGVGFNAVYHLTDVPSFINVGPGMDKAIYILDPHMKYVPVENPTKHGTQISELDDLRESYKDMFSGYLEDIVKINKQGTLFRFPLRTKEMASQSKIKTCEITKHCVTVLLKKFQIDLFDCLLFLHNLKKVSIASITEKDGLDVEYCIKATVSDKDKNAHQGFISHLKNQSEKIKDPAAGIGLEDVSPLETELMLSVNDSQGRQQDWIVFHHSGFSKKTPIPEPLISAWEDGDICLLPRGGVAVPLTTDGKGMKDFQGKAFCILPLPITTGLPVHVNGHFALDHEARRHLWHGNEDYRSVWNRHIIDAIITPAYILAMHSMKKRIGLTQENSKRCIYESLNNYYSFFPDKSSTNHKVWHDVVVSFYLDLVNNNTRLFGVVKPGEGLFANVSRTEVGDMRCKVIWVPATCLKGFPGFFNILEKTQKTFSQSDEKGQGHVSVLFPQIKEDFKQENAIAWHLTEILKDLNMHVIDVPFRIFDNTKAVHKELHYVTPENVIHFLKSHTSETKDSCTLSSLPLNLQHTALKNIKSLKLLIRFCSKHKAFCAEMESLPLALTKSLKLNKFHAESPLIATRYTDLLTGTPDLVMHEDIVDLYEKHVDDTPCLKKLDISSLACLIGKTLKADIFHTGSNVIWQELPEYPSKQWVVRFWEYCFTQVPERKEQNFDIHKFLTELQGWSLFPSNRQQDGILTLYPIKDSRSVIDMKFVLKEDHKTALKKLEIPILDRSVFQRCSGGLELTSHIAASWQNPGTIMTLLSNIPFSAYQTVTSIECQALLEYCSTNLDQINGELGFETAQMLFRRICLFESMCGKLVALQNCPKVVAIQYHWQVYFDDGFRELTEASDTVCLKKHESCLKIFDYLNIKTQNREELYVSLILPYFQCFPLPAKQLHLRYIRNYLLHNKLLIVELKKLQFIEAIDGTLCCASHFYSNYNKVFKEMLNPSDFPPPPYDTKEWQKFLECAGMKKNMTEELFLKFIKKVEHIGSKGIGENVERKSEILTKALADNHQHFGRPALSQIGKVKFLLPHVVSGTDLGKYLTDICPQRDGGQHLVSYSESLAPRQRNCVWTSCHMFQEFADPRNWQSSNTTEVLYSSLGIQMDPDSRLVAMHMDNVCLSLLTLQNQNNEKLSKWDKIVQLIMASIYKYLMRVGVRDWMKLQLKNVCTIYVPAEKCMVPAEEVVKVIHPHEVVKGYLWALPDELAQFHTVFLGLGASEYVHANLYACVLDKLYKKADGQKLHDNELSVAQKAISLMFSYIHKEKEENNCTLEVPSLYLPDKNLILRESRQLVFNDSCPIYERIQSLDLHYFLGFKMLNLDHFNRDPLTNLTALPEQYQLKLLTSLVVEDIAAESKSRAISGDVAQKYMNVLKRPQFVRAVVRLVNHETYLLKKESVDTSEAESIEEKLARLEILEVENMQTELWMDGNVVQGSQNKCMYYQDNRKGSSTWFVYIYIDNDIHGSDLYSGLVSTVDCLTSGKLRTSSLHLHHLLDSTPETYESYLDRKGIRPYNYDCKAEAEKEQNAFSPPGSFIPEDMYWLLDNSFNVFDKGEYVGLEVFDPLMDTESQVGGVKNSIPVYIYAIVKKVVIKDSLSIRGKYLVDVGESQKKEISGTMLYKILRRNSKVNEPSLQPEHDDINLVLKRIRDILKDAWANCAHQKERNRIRKRLYFSWHPDKNPGREAFCTQVCQHIRNYVIKLEAGQSIDCDDDISTSEYAARQPFFEHMNRRCSKERAQYEQYQQKNEEERNCHHSARDHSHSQPQEARRWLGQAMCDLRSARDTLQLHRDFNWVCFKAHMAAEKAVISVWYNRNADKADTLRGKNLFHTEAGLNNSCLSELVSELQNLVGDFNQMHYPDKLSCPKIPAELYTERTAGKACEIAESILDLVKELLGEMQW